MRLTAKALSAAALMAGVATHSFSAVPQDYLATFDQVLGNRLIGRDGSTILITPSENQLTREVVAANGAVERTLFTFLTEQVGTVSNAGDPGRVTGVFRITGAGIEIRYGDGRTETIAANDMGGVTSELTSAGTDACIAWYPESQLQRVAAFTPGTGCPPRQPETAEPPQGPKALLPELLNEFTQLEAKIDRIEAETNTRVAAPPDNRIEQIRLLGKALIYDKQLSVNHNEACAFCHMPETGFTGPISGLNRAGAVYPGSVRDRFGMRRPPSQSYAPFSPVLHVSPARGLVGGTFMDMRATGMRLGNPSAEQAEAPLTNPVEMGLPDPACAVYRASQRPYRGTFQNVWGAQVFAIAWPADVEQVCSRPGPAAADDPLPVHLSSSDRGRVAATLDAMAQSIASFEGSTEVSAFTAKFDAIQAGKAQFSTQEQAGLDLFRGKAKCTACHDSNGPAPLFTNFTANNTGVPANRRLPFYTENQPDPSRFAANPVGASFVDRGVGGFLSLNNPGSSSVDSTLLALAPQNQSRFQVPTLRNVDKRPDPGFVKAYGHNGYFKDLKTVVHFYNTRDVLRRCDVNDEGEGKTCWPAPESTDNLVTGVVGRLGLTDEEEDALVAFLKTLSDGFSPALNTASNAP